MLDDIFVNTDNYQGIVVMFVAAIALSIPLIRVVRSDESLTWTKSVLLGTWLTLIVTILIAEVPSRMLYWVDSNHNGVAERFSFLAPLMDGTIQFLGMQVQTYIIVRDILVNTVQIIFFVIIVALIYMWGERHRKAGRFKSS